MTNAIEQTKRAMYEALRITIQCFNSLPTQKLEDALEAHLEAVRQDRAKIIEERDELRNKHQALQMASQTAAEVIRGLRSELLEARECNATGKQSREPESANTDPYTLGFNSRGERCPFAINTVERLHWMDGARESLPYVIVPGPRPEEEPFWWPFS